MWSITTPLIGEELQLIINKSGRRTMLHLWLKLIFALVMFLGSLLLLKVVSARWLVVGLQITAVSFSLAPVFISLDMFFYYVLPGIQLTDEGLWTKKAKSIHHKFYPYQDLMQIEQLTTVEKKMKHQVKLSFSDGNSWSTNKRPNPGVPFLIHLTNELEKRCSCSVWPVFDEEFAPEKPGQQRLVDEKGVER